mgnify:CR=1 FL=1
MSVSHPQNGPFISIVDAVYQEYFTSKLTQLPTE